MSNAKTGKRLFSTVSTVELVVVKGADATIECGGVPMVDAKVGAPGSEAAGEAVQLSKRYADELTGVLVLCTKAGLGPLTIEGRPLQLLATKPLPSSD